MMRSTTLLAALVVVSLTAPCVRAAEIQVHAAASLTDALTEIGARFEKSTGTKVRFNFAGSSTLARQIEAGAPGDVFVSADEAKMDALSAAGLVSAGTRRSFLGNSLVIIVPPDAAGEIRTPRDLATSRVHRVALAETRSVPAGIYARQYLEKTGLWNAIAPKVVPTDSVRAALLAVEGGNVDAGILYRTDAMMSREVKAIYEVTGAEAPAISYPVAVLSGSVNAKAALKFVDFLSGPEARAVFVRLGFKVR